MNQLQSYLLIFIIFFINLTGWSSESGNQEKRLRWFEDQAFGMFIHWSLDSQLGLIISHSLVGASDNYTRKYIEELPKTFYPDKFNPDSWARIAKLTGMKYMVFTVKHHSGFCMWDTKTTNFSVMHTAYGKDVTQEIFRAFRKHDIAVGLYFSPDDWWFLEKKGIEPSRLRPESLPSSIPELVEHNKEQLKELLTQYGQIDVIFFDIKRKDPRDLKQHVWSLQPNTIITRGELATPEKKIPDQIIPRPWEACHTMGHSWQYRPTNEQYESPTRIIEKLIEIRSKGGNYLLNVGPKPDGKLPPEQIKILQEVALWQFINGEAIYKVKPCPVLREKNIWYTQSKDEKHVYAFVTGEPWIWAKSYTIVLSRIKATQSTSIELLGQSGKILEYHPDVNPETIWQQSDNGLMIKAMRAPRIYNSRNWPNPVVIKMTDVQFIQ